ncbi:MAG: hypothetical protein ACRC06_09455 [Waterburya sp.]
MATCTQGYLMSDYPSGTLRDYASRVRLRDRSRNIILIDGQDHSVSQLLIPLATKSTITAITANSTHLLIASISPTQILLQRFSWS